MEVGAGAKGLPNFNVVLIEPEIPSNTGNIGRTCVGTCSHLHLVGPLGFEITDKQVKRAGLDYWPDLQISQYENWDAWWKQVVDPSRVFLFTTKSKANYCQVQFRPGDWLVFGKETKGLDQALLENFSNQSLTIPMPGKIRSLNLATAVAIVLFEGLRQFDQP